MTEGMIADQKSGICPILQHIHLRRIGIELNAVGKSVGRDSVRLERANHVPGYFDPAAAYRQGAHSRQVVNCQGNLDFVNGARGRMT